MYSIWSQGNCESHVDIIKMLGAIDFFLPYFPLEASNIRDLFVKRLQDQAHQLRRSDNINLTWSAFVVDFLLSKVTPSGLLLLVKCTNSLCKHFA